MCDYQRHKIIPQYPAPNRWPKRWFKGLGFTSQFPAQCWKSYLFHWKRSELLKGLSIHMEKYKKSLKPPTGHPFLKDPKNHPLRYPHGPQWRTPGCHNGSPATSCPTRISSSEPRNKRCSRAGTPVDSWEIMVKIPMSWKLNGKIMGKPREKHGKNMGQSQIMKGKSHWFFEEALNGNITNFYCNQWWIFQQTTLRRLIDGRYNYGWWYNSFITPTAVVYGYLRFALKCC